MQALIARATVSFPELRHGKKSMKELLHKLFVDLTAFKLYQAVTSALQYEFLLTIALDHYEQAAHVQAKLDQQYADRKGCLKQIAAATSNVAINAPQESAPLEASAEAAANHQVLEHVAVCPIAIPPLDVARMSLERLTIEYTKTNSALQSLWQKLTSSTLDTVNYGILGLITDDVGSMRKNLRSYSKAMIEKAKSH